jgi:uncharacterized circularly permuted ATP-grasp superfamily protein
VRALPIDETFTPGLRPRPHYVPVLEQFTAQGPGELAAWALARAEAVGMPPLDPFPFILTHAEWSRVARHLIGRVRRLDPPSIGITGHDVARDATGEFTVLADHLQAPAGMAYAVHARRILRERLTVTAMDFERPLIDGMWRVLRAASAREDPRAAILGEGWERRALADLLGIEAVDDSRGFDVVWPPVDEPEEHLLLADRPALISTHPTVEDGLLEPRPVHLRLFAVTDSDTVTVLPGGCAGIGAGCRKDVWILPPASGE